MNLAILGFSREGQSLLKFLKKKYPKASIAVLDKNAAAALPRGVEGHLGASYLSGIEKFNTVYRSPGIPYNTPELAAARRKGVAVKSATHLFFEQMRAKHPGVPIIAITGSKGKSTTTTLVHRILKAAGKKAILAGNIGISAISVLPRARKDSVVIVELSSFQLQGLPYSPDIAAVTEMFPEHQDAHGSLREYYKAKESIASHQKKTDTIFYFPKNAISKRIAMKSPGHKIPVDEKSFSVFSPEDLKIRGSHNFRNAVMAALIARAAGAPDSAIVSAVSSFPGLDHRLQFVRRLGNVEFYDDSASTNPVSMIGAIRSFPDRGVVLIAGGYDKGLDYSPLAAALPRSTVRLVVLVGANKKKIAASLAKKAPRIITAATLEDAVLAAHRFCLSTSAKFAVVLSPGAASFDMFANYADRGDTFKKIVRKLTLKPSKR